MPLNRPIALTLALAAGLAALLAASGCDAARTAPAGRGLKTGHFELSPEARRLLPRGAVLYYGKADTIGLKDRWAVEELDVDTGRTREIISTDSSGLVDLQPYSISPDNRFLLVSARAKNDEKTFLMELDVESGAWRKIMDDAVRGFYSPDGTKIVLYTSRGASLETVRHSVYIMELKNSVLHEVPCDTTSCRHSSWDPEGTSIIYVDGDNRIYSYSVKDERRSEIIVERNLHQEKISYPIFCGRRIIYFVRKKTAEYSKLLGYRTYQRELRSLLPGDFAPRRLGDFTDVPNIVCHPTISSAIGVHNVRKQGLYLALLQLQPKRIVRLIPPQPSRLMYINPVLTVRQ